MKALFFIGDTDWTPRARIFTLAAHGLSARGHEITIACPAGPIIDKIDAKAISVVRIDPAANAALGSFDFRRVAQERSLDAVFVHSTREQFMVGSGFRFARGSNLVRRVGIFERHDDAGLLTTRLTPARLLVSPNAEAAAIINAAAPPPVVAPLGVDIQAADFIAPMERRALHMRDDALIVACPYAPNGRVRLLNMMRTVALLAPRHPRLRVIVHGERAGDDDLRMQAAALGVAPLISFVSASQFETPALMKAADFAWIVADHDAAALGCLDAMAAGRAVIAERSATIEYFVADGINGVVLPEAESSTVTAAVAAVITRNEARAAYGNAGRQRVQRELGLTGMIDGFERALSGATQPLAAR